MNLTDALTKLDENLANYSMPSSLCLKNIFETMENQLSIAGEEMRAKFRQLAEKSLTALNEFAAGNLSREDLETALKTYRKAAVNYVEANQILAGKIVLNKFQATMNDVLSFITKIVLGQII